MKFGLPLLVFTMKFSSCSVGLVSLVALLTSNSCSAKVWNRVSTFLACKQDHLTCNSDLTTVAEILAATTDGKTIVYTDGPNKRVGFVDITDPKNPIAGGTVTLAGEPTSIDVTPDGLFAVVAVNTSPNFVSTSGLLAVIDLATKSVITTLDVGGQPDSVAVSPDGDYIAVVIENERDEDLGDGAPPQLPPGAFVIVDASSPDPSNWAKSVVTLTGLPGLLFGSDPEPEFVAINKNNVAALTFQENNAIATINLATKTVLTSFSAGTVDLTGIDTKEEGVISLTSSLQNVAREPDAVAWIGNEFFVTANEGDLNGGSRGFTIFSASDNSIVYDSGNLLERIAVMHGHYQEGRSGNRGTEPCFVNYFRASDFTHFLAVVLERSGLTVLFEIDPLDPSEPIFVQVLPVLTDPESMKVIPSRNLLVIASEGDDRAAGLRAGITIYEYQDASFPSYPSLLAANRVDGTPIPFSALSGLASAGAYFLSRALQGNVLLLACDTHAHYFLQPYIYADPAGVPLGRRRLDAKSSRLFSVEDSAYKRSRILTINTASFPYIVEAESRIVDTNNVLASAFPTTPSLLNADKTVNLDAEGIAVSYKGGFWIANEGAGNAPTPGSTNFIIKVADNGTIEEVIKLPAEVNDLQIRFGFEGVAEQGDYLVVVFQRAWGTEANPRIGIYNEVDKTWKFVFYPLDVPVSQYPGGWVGLSDIAPLGYGAFLVVERDNRGGPDAAFKKLFQIDLGDFSVASGSTITKAFVSDLRPVLQSLNGLVFEKIEGVAVTAGGGVWINNDNDGVNDNSGEQQLIYLGKLFNPYTKSPIAAPVTAPATAPTPASSGLFGFILTVFQAIGFVVIDLVNLLYDFFW